MKKHQRETADVIVDAFLKHFIPAARARIEAFQHSQDPTSLKILGAMFEQSLDSLAAIASHIPLPLMTALIKWRQSEWKRTQEKAKGPVAPTSILQQKLGVENVFSCACVRFAENCPLNSIPEDLWLGLEDYVFDWLSYAEKCVPLNENPSLAEHRTILLDNIAHLARALSTKRFHSLTQRFFLELDSRAVDNPTIRSEGASFARHVPVLDYFLTKQVADSRARHDANMSRLELLNIIHGMRLIQLPIKTAKELMAAKAFIIRSNPMNRAPSKKRLELQHALCLMLNSVLSPLTESSDWPPHVTGDAQTAWNSTVLQMRSQLVGWMEKQSSLLDKQPRHIQVAYPLITVLLCLGDKHHFLSSFGDWMGALFKQLKEKYFKSIAIDSIYRAVSFYLTVHARTCSKREVADCLQKIAGQLVPVLKKVGSVQDLQVDRIVDLCLLIANTNFNFVMDDIVLELLRAPSLSESKVIGLFTLLTMVNFAVSQVTRTGRGGNRGHSFPEKVSEVSSVSLGLVELRKMGLELDDVPLISPYMDKIRNALGGIIKMCHSSFGTVHLIMNRTGADPGPGKEKLPGWLVFKWALRCAPHLVPRQWRLERMVDRVPVYAISVDPGIREEASQVLFRTVREIPGMRFPVLRGLANFALRVPNEFPSLVQGNLGRLVQLMTAWRACVVLEAAQKLPGTSVPILSLPQKGRLLSSRRATPVLGSDFDEEYAPLDFVGMDAIGLIFLCSSDSGIRRLALELLRNIRGLKLELIQHGFEAALGLETPQEACVIDVFEEMGESIVQKCYFDDLNWQDRRSYEGGEAVPSDASLSVIIEGNDRQRWARCLSELVKYCSNICPEALLGARIEIVSRLSHMDPSVDPNVAAPKSANVSSDYLDQWLLYAVFACSCPPEEAEDGGLKSNKDLLHLVLPMARHGLDPLTEAVSLALGSSHEEVCEAMLTELVSWIEETKLEVDSRKLKKLRKEDLKMFEANVYRLVARNLWPGTIQKRPWLRQQYFLFITEMSFLIPQCSGEGFWDAQPLRFALASVVQFIGKELVESASDRFDVKFRRKLFDFFGAMSDEFTFGTVPEPSSAADFRREVDRFRASAVAKAKDPLERSIVEREISDQVEAIEWMSLQAMAVLCYGPCFDENFRKLMGKTIYWINALIDEKYGSHRGPFPGKDKKGIIGLVHRRNSVAKSALMNCLQSNLDLVPACIDQCYSEDMSLGNGYFKVLAEIYMRYECVGCSTQRLISLIFYKLVDPSREIRDDALQMLEALSARRWSGETDANGGRYTAAVVGSLPDSFQQFQYELSCKLAREHPELSELLCEEIMQRQLDSVDIVAQHQVLTCMTPWMENLNLQALWDSGWSERLLKSLYYVTWKHGDHFPVDIEKLWSTLAQKSRNIIPVLDFLVSKGVADCDSNASGEISEALVTFFSVAKRASLYLARISPQQTIDHLVFELSQKKTEEDTEIDNKRASDAFDRDLETISFLEFSQGPIPSQEPTTPSPSSQAPHESAGVPKGPVDPKAVPHKRASSAIPLPWGFRSSARTKSSEFNWSKGSSTRFRSMGGKSMSTGLNDNFRSLTMEPGTSSSGGHETPSLSVHGSPKLFPYALTRADVALVLLAEIAYENDEDFRGHLPVIFHTCFICLDSSEPIVLEHAQQLLVNLLYTLAGRHLQMYEGREVDHGDYKNKVVSLIKYVQSKKGHLLWEIEDMSVVGIPLKSASLISSLVLSVVDAIFFQNDLRERWGAESFSWVLRSRSRHAAGRSHQIFRALHPPLSPDSALSLLHCLHLCLTVPSNLMLLGTVQEIILTLQVMVENMPAQKMILYPQLFWACLALLHSDFVHVYASALTLLTKVIDRVNFNDPTHTQVLLSCMPGQGGSSLEEGLLYGDNDSAPPFEGLQPVILKGLISAVSHDLAIDILARLNSLSCDPIVGLDSVNRVVLQCVGLLPWLSLLLENQLRFTQFELKRGRDVAYDLGNYCMRENFFELASVFFLYSNEQLSSPEDFISRAVCLLCPILPADTASSATAHLLRLLDKGPPSYRRTVLVALASLLDSGVVSLAQIPLLYSCVSPFLEVPSCRREAKKVVEAVLGSAMRANDRPRGRGSGTLAPRPVPSQGRAPRFTQSSQVGSFSNHPSPGSPLDGPETLKRSSSGPQEPSGDMPAGRRGPNLTIGVGSGELLPTRDEGFGDARRSLAGVLGTYGRAEEDKSLVPFVHVLAAQSESPATAATSKDHSPSFPHLTSSKTM